MSEWTWEFNEVGLIIDKTEWDDQLFDCLVLYSGGSLRGRRLPHKLIYSDSLLHTAISNMEFYVDFCAPNYAPINWHHDPIEWTFDSNDGISLVIAKNHIDSNYEDHEFDLFKCVLITAGGFVERAVYRFQYQMSCIDQTKINRMTEAEYRTFKSNQQSEKSIMSVGNDFLNRIMWRK